MPRYTYFCNFCEEEFEVIHSMQEEWEECSICLKSGNIERIPALIGSLGLKNLERRVGEVVKDHIKEARADLNNHKKELKSKVIE